MLDGSWEGLGWVLGLSSSKTDKLSSGESEGCNDEDGAESTESVLERTWVVPKTGTPVLAVTSTLWPTTANEKARAHLNLGVAYMRSSKFKDAREAMDAALKLDPGFKDAQENLAVLVSLGEEDGDRQLEVEVA